MSAKPEQIPFPLSTSSAGASPARTSARPVPDVASLVRAPAWRGSSSASSARWPRPSSWSRTPGTAGGDGCPNCGAPCGPEGTPACRFSCPPARLARPIVEHGCFSSPGDAGLPTPTCGYAKRSGSRTKPGSKAHPGYTLTDSVCRGQGPGASSSVLRGPLPTPTASRYGTRNNGDPRDGRGSYRTAGSPSLDTMAARGQLPGPLPTPMARDWRSGRASAETHAKNSRPLSEVAGGHLHPRFVEWMMGLAQGWTAPG